MIKCELENKNQKGEERRKNEWRKLSKLFPIVNIIYLYIVWIYYSLTDLGRWPEKDNSQRKSKQFMSDDMFEQTVSSQHFIQSIIIIILAQHV